MNELEYAKFEKSIWKDTRIKGNEKYILIYLISYHNKEYGYSFPTYEQIQDDTGISRNTLAKVLKSLECKGYIKRDKYKNNNGWNNVYYINKYLVTSKNNNMNSLEPTGATTDNQSTNNSNDNIKSDTEPIRKTELSVNEKLLKDIGIHKLNNKQLEQLNKLDTDKLIKTIEIAKQNSNNINFNYLITIYNNKNTYEEPHKNNKGQVVKGAKQQVFTGNTVTTKYHNTFNEHFRKYSEEELEAKLLKVQNKKRVSANL